MCFGGGNDKPPTPPKYNPPPIPPPPPAPAPVKAAPTQPIQQQETTAVRAKSSARERLGIRRGTSQLRIPLNTGVSKSGGLNL